MQNVENYTVFGQKLHCFDYLIPYYDVFKSYLLQSCVRDTYSVLCEDCESGQCGHWEKHFSGLTSKISAVATKNKITKKFTYTRFEYVKTEEFGTKLQPITSPQSLEEISAYLGSKLHKFIEHSNTYLRERTLWKILKPFTISNQSALIVIDFSENLSIPVQNEPQTMYWVRKQVSIMSVISETPLKTYYGHLSESRIHDQVYTKESIVEIIRSIPPQEQYVIRSDNANHFKCAQCFYDLQIISDEFLATIVRVYGISGHCKGEVDSADRHIKNAIRNRIRAGDYILDTDDCLAALNEKFCDYTNPSYSFRKIEAEKLIEKRNEVLKLDFKRVDGTMDFHVLVFKPFQKFFHASNVICVCENCIDRNYAACSNFKEYYPEVTVLSKPLTRYAKVTIEEEEESTVSVMGGMVTEGSIFAVKADNATHDFFLFLCTKTQTAHGEKSPLKDTFGHIIHLGELFITGVYLEIADYGKKCINYNVTRTEVFVHSGTVFFPQVPVKTTKAGVYKLSNDMVVELNIRSSLNTNDF